MNKRNKRQHGFDVRVRDPAETRGIGGILAGLFRTILHENNVGGNKFEILLSDFINNARRGVMASRVKRHFTRGNLRRELEKGTMTFKVFMKGLRFMKIRFVTISVELTHASGRKSTHSAKVDLGGADIQAELVNDDSEKDDKDED